MQVSASSGTVILCRRDVRRILAMRPCIDAVERAFAGHARGATIPPGVLGAHVDGGGFHIKTAGILAESANDRPVFVAKVNANFPGNPRRSGFPTIQGVLALFDADDGRLLALLDSMEITSVRTAAATAVAAKYMARADATSVGICGCGEQGRSQLRALACVRSIRRAAAFDLDYERARHYAAEMSSELAIEVAPVREVADATRQADIVVTCTTSTHWFLGRQHVGNGTFIAAVGADNPHKQEIEPELLAESTVVADMLEQCATIGDLHHALAAGVMHRADVHAELTDVVSGAKPGRVSPDETIVFDSTGTALEDVAAAMLVYEAAIGSGSGLTLDLGK